MNHQTTDKVPEMQADSTPSPDAASSGTEPTLPNYKGAPLDPQLGPGLGCFWIQLALLIILLVATPLSVIMAAPSEVSAALLIGALGLLFFVGQTMIFLLRLVAADRRTRRRPLSPTARQTIGQMEEEHPTGSDEDDAASDQRDAGT